MSKSVSILIFLITLSVLGAGLYFATRKNPSSNLNLDNFAKCLTDKGMVMYGAYWCPHCQNIKKLFGDSFQYIKYVECTVETKTCTDKAINGYPTFLFADGSRLEGEISLSQFSQKTSCDNPTTNSN